MFKKLDDVVVTNKVVFLRVDYNVPIKDNQIVDTFRIDKSLKTLNYLLKNGAKVIVCTHIGRPKGKFVPDLSYNSY